MIHLDTNMLVELVAVGSPGGRRILQWVGSGREIGASAIAWSEFCNGPLSLAQKDAAFNVLNRRIADFDWLQGETAARLFNLTGRRRGSHADCMIAAAAMASGATLATRNISDFERFLEYGLGLEEST